MASRQSASSSRNEAGGGKGGGSSPESSSSKASSPAETPRSQIDFQFLNFSHPSDAKASRARRAVRSHVTKQQHQREHALQAARAHQSVTTAGLATLRSGPTAAISPTGSPDSASQSPSPTAFPTYAPERRLEPTELYPEVWLPYIPSIMTAYFNNMGVDIVGFDAETTTSLIRGKFFPFIWTDAAPLHAVMLVAVCHFQRQNGARSHPIDLLQLRGMAIRAINGALEDPVRATSDHVITAVAEMAAFEAVFGNRDICNTHMTGLVRMVSLRGGLPALGLDGLLERIVLWIDANASHTTRSHLYFDKAAFPTRAVHPRPDTGRFSGSSANEQES